MQKLGGDKALVTPDKNVGGTCLLPTRPFRFVITDFRRYRKNKRTELDDRRLTLCNEMLEDKSISAPTW